MAAEEVAMAADRKVLWVGSTARAVMVSVVEATVWEGQMAA